MTGPAPRFPIGPIQPLPTRDRAALEDVAARMTAATAEWRALVTPLDAAGLAHRYRPGAWTVAQLAHHTADAHLHGLNRLRYALTTPDYVIQPFDQDAWLTLPDATLPVTVALNLLDAVNAHWIALLEGMDATDLDRMITHPNEGPQDLWQLVAKHDWHLRHHLAQARGALG
ncbi:DinB family protein [Deinococcus sp.]|uniref:DinB family protein n=1 Tax=Deinococcus sp. TaxID=47478 RepID=UPI002869CF28|nr:DinB family protein [Deinococcus sp.]